jgi:hypothetical protein
MDLDFDLVLLLLAIGPISATGFYWAIYRYYRNIDKTHAFEHETAVQRLSLTGTEADRKVDETRGTRATRIRGDNVHQHRQRVNPL